MLRLLLAAILFPALGTAQIEVELNIVPCSLTGYSSPKDNTETNLRAAPRADAKVLGHLPGLSSGAGNAEPEFEITGSKNGWLLIRNVRTADPAVPPRVLLAGPAWIWGGLAGVQVADYTLKAAPVSDARVLARFLDLAKGLGPDSYGVRAIHACMGRFVELTAAGPDGKEMRGWVQRTCAGQLTTCDMGGVPMPPSFDCSAAQTRTEKTICGDSELGSLDQSLGYEFQNALASVPRPMALRAGQRHWLAEVRDKTADAVSLRQAYQSRVRELQGIAKTADDVRKTEMGDPARTCAALRHEADEICQVEESGPLGEGFTYQRQAYFAGTLRIAGGVVVLRGAKGALHPVLWDQADTAHFEKPEWINSAGGRLLAMDGHMEGTGNFPVSSLYRAAVEPTAVWREIDIESWLGELAARVPNGLAFRKGIFPDWRRMTAETPLWRGADGECCPSGGKARAWLEIRGDRVALKSVSISKEN